MKPLVLSCLCLVALSAQSTETAPSPYAGQERRAIKTLSSEEVTELLAGKGMGLAKAAELNGYPGPAHVLELASQLQLTDEQRHATDALYRSMQTKAKDLGAEIVAREQALNEMFANKKISEQELSKAVDEIGTLQSRLRTAHLEAHLAEARVLTREQVERYNQLRGYDAPGAEHGSHIHAH